MAHFFSFGESIIDICDTESFGYHGYCGRIYVDIDGQNKGKNLLGTDLFIFSITKDGVQPFATRDNVSNFCEQNLRAFSSTWVLETGNTDYSLLNNGCSCPKGEELSWSNQSCN